MIYWYALTDQEINDLQSSVTWFKDNNTNLLDNLYEVYYVSGTAKNLFITNDKNENYRLQKCYRLKKGSKLPPEVISTLSGKLKPFIVGVH